MENASGKNAKSCSAFTNVHELSTALDSGKMTIFAFLMTTRSCNLFATLKLSSMIHHKTFSHNPYNDKLKTDVMTLQITQSLSW
jgi:hypothetical protein